MEFTNPPDQIFVDVYNVKEYQDRMTGEIKKIKKNYMTNYINYDSLPEKLQRSISKYTMKHYGIEI